MAIARTMMLHSAIHWPDVANPTLWPLAGKHAVVLVNHMPDPRTGLSPSDVFTKTRWEQKKLMDVHLWGCPVYVLDREWSLVQWLQMLILCGEDVGSNPAGKLFTPQKLSIHIPNPSLCPSLRWRRGRVPGEILQTFP